MLPRVAVHVILRRLHPDDLPAFEAYRGDDELGRYQGWSVKRGPEARAFLEEMSAASLLQPGSWSQVGIATPDGDPVLAGDIGLRLSEDGREAELGVTLSRAAQGRGLATAAVREAIAMVFENTRAERVIAVTDARNLASMRLLERVGMTRASTSPAVFRGEPCIEHTYAILRR
jgi:[ribosomal protein S5]-alanine N-acetyltransferase